MDLCKPYCKRGIYKLTIARDVALPCTPILIIVILDKLMNFNVSFWKRQIKPPNNRKGSISTVLVVLQVHTGMRRRIHLYRAPELLYSNSLAQMYVYPWIGFVEFNIVSM
jgi:hypothetical protein